MRGWGGPYQDLQEDSRSLHGLFLPFYSGCSSEGNQIEGSHRDDVRVSLRTHEIEHPEGLPVQGTRQRGVTHTTQWQAYSVMFPRSARPIVTRGEPLLRIGRKATCSETPARSAVGVRASTPVSGATRSTAWSAMYDMQ